MRIAMTIHALQGGGAEHVLTQLAGRWVAAGHEVHVVTWSAISQDPPALPPGLQRHGLDLLRPSHNLWQSVWANVKRHRRLRARLLHIQPDVVLSFCDQMNISTLRATRGLRLPIWIAERSDPARQRLSALWERWRRKYYPRCTGCIVQTETIADFLSQIVPRDRMFVIPNAVNLPPVPATALHVAANHSAPLQTTSSGIILSVGRLSPEKGLDVLLKAWRIAQPQLGTWQLHLAGDGPQRSELQAYCHDLPSVRFLGWLQDPQPAFAGADIFVLPSRYEGFPNALLEAMSHGLPCLATRCSQAVEDLSRGGSAVLTVAPDQADGLAAALIQLAHSPERRQQLGLSARLVSENYTWNRIGPLWDQVVRS
jgi:GalNAc-alpha-(1->4)-GalNAc-alpha-(1->3)-diNAcBac-PP-undecaprenol alpha-1,4-N-acetyl-D-galactosaminyltransferase